MNITDPVQEKLDTLIASLAANRWEIVDFIAIRREFRDKAKMDVSEPTLRRWLARLVKEGRLVRLSWGRYALASEAIARQDLCDKLLALLAEEFPNPVRYNTLKDRIGENMADELCGLFMHEAIRLVSNRPSTNPSFTLSCKPETPHAG